MLERTVTIDLDTDSLDTLIAQLDHFDVLSDASTQPCVTPRYCDECWRLVTHTATVCWHCDAVLGGKC